MQVGVQVGIAEAVDRLLRVAHQEQRRRAVAVDRVGRSRTAAGRCPGTRRSARPGSACAATAASAAPPSRGQALVQVEEHVVEGRDAPLALGAAQRVRAFARAARAAVAGAAAPALSSWAACSASSVSALRRRTGAARRGALPWFGFSIAAPSRSSLSQPGQRRRRGRPAPPAGPSCEGLLQRRRLVARAVQSRPRLGDDGDDRLALAAATARARQRRRPASAAGVGRFDRRVAAPRARAAATAAWPGGARAARTGSPACPCARAGGAASAGDSASPAMRRRQKSCTTPQPQLAVVAAAASSAIGMPVLKGASASARWQKPWMVKIEASSKVCSASVQAQQHVRIGQAVPAAQAVQQRRRRRGPRSGGAAPRRRASVSAMRARMRSRSSAVAALVKVTTRMCCTSRRRSSSSRRYRPHRFQVLPVPAEASIRRVPSSGQPKTSKAAARHVRHAAHLRSMLAQRAEDGAGQRFEVGVQRIVDAAQRQPVGRVVGFAEAALRRGQPGAQRLAAAMQHAASRRLRGKKCSGSHRPRRYSASSVAQMRSRRRRRVRSRTRRRRTASACAAPRRRVRRRTAPGAAARLRGSRRRGCRRSASAAGPRAAGRRSRPAATRPRRRSSNSSARACGGRQASAVASRSRSREAPAAPRVRAAAAASPKRAGGHLGAGAGQAPTPPRRRCPAAAAAAGGAPARRARGHRGTKGSSSCSSSASSRQLDAQAAAQQVAAGVAEELDQLRQRHLPPGRFGRGQRCAEEGQLRSRRRGVFVVVVVIGVVASSAPSVASAAAAAPGAPRLCRSASASSRL